MKVIKLVTLLTLGIGIALGSVGCKTRNPPAPIQFDEQGRPIAGNPGEPGGGGKIEGEPGVGTTPGTTGIPMGSGHPGWGEVRETLQADTIHFEYDSAVVKPGEHSKVTAVADYLKSNPSNAVKVEGHCDERGTDEYNRSLGERRAQAIRAELVKGGVDATRVDTVSFGRDRPVDTGHAEASHRKNRRGEFVVLTPPK